MTMYIFKSREVPIFMYCPNFIKAGGSNPTYCPDFIRVMSMQNMGYDNQTFGLKVLFESKGSIVKYSDI